MQELIIKERQAREKIAKLMNELDLPAFILKPIIKEVYEQLYNLDIQQYEKAKQESIKEGGKE